MFDPFGRGRYCYTYREKCLEDGDLPGDGTCKIFLNVKGKNPEEVPRELVDFLHYVEKAELPESPDDGFLRHLHERISQIKHDRRMEGRYMTFGELLDEERREGRIEGHAEGLAEGQSRLLTLINAMTADDRTAEIPRLAEDEGFVEEMLAQYHIIGDACEASNA